MGNEKQILLVNDCEYTKTVVEEYCRKDPDLNFSYLSTSSLGGTLPANSKKPDVIIFDAVANLHKSDQTCLHKKRGMIQELAPGSELIILTDRQSCTCSQCTNLFDSDTFVNKNNFPTLFKKLKEYKQLPKTEIQVPKTSQVLPKPDQEIANILYLSIEQSLSSIIITDTNGIFEYANPAFYQITGFSPNDIIGKTPRILKSGKHPRDFYRNIWETIKSGKEWKGSICNRKKGGDLYWVYQSITPIKNEYGKIIKFVAVRLDDTARRKAEQEAKAYSDELARSNKDLAEFASIASHDLQEPLRKIVTFTDLMASKIPAGSDALVSYMNKVRSSALRMKELLNDLLLYSYANRKKKQGAVLDN